MRHYLGVFGHTDLSSETLSSRAFEVTLAPGPAYVIVKTGRTYFENRDELDAVRAKFKRVHVVAIRGKPAVEVFTNR